MASRSLSQRVVYAWRRGSVPGGPPGCAPWGIASRGIVSFREVGAARCAAAVPPRGSPASPSRAAASMLPWDTTASAAARSSSLLLRVTLSTEAPDHEGAAGAGAPTREDDGADDDVDDTVDDGFVRCANEGGVAPRTNEALFGSVKVPGDVASEVHATANADIEFPVSRMTRLWWQCKKDPRHKWRTQLRSRWANHRWSGCPYCQMRLATQETSLAALHPEIAARWDATRNEEGAHEVRPGRPQVAWWRCEEGPDHVWQRSVADEVKFNRGCPMCKGKMFSVTNSVATLFPHVAAEWHPTKNGALTAAKVRSMSDRPVWFKCPEGPDHEWETRVRYRTMKGRGCPFCAGKRASVTNSIASLAPDLAREWHPTKNAPLTPEQVTIGSRRQVWWLRADTGEEFQARINSRTTKLRKKLLRLRNRQ